MKLDNVEITGVDTVVIHTPMDDDTTRTVVFKKRDLDNRWVREGKTTDIHEHNEMVNKIKRFSNSEWHRVWINGTYVNIMPRY